VFVLVAVYIAASIFAEIAPDRFLRGTPADDGGDRLVGARSAETKPPLRRDAPGGNESRHGRRWNTCMALAARPGPGADRLIRDA